MMILQTQAEKGRLVHRAFLPSGASNHKVFLNISFVRNILNINFKCAKVRAIEQNVN